MIAHKIQIFPNSYQRGILGLYGKFFGDLRFKVLKELIRQYNEISLFQSEYEVIRSEIDNPDNTLNQQNIQHMVRIIYEEFNLRMKKEQGSNMKVRLKKTRALNLCIEKDDIIFSDKKHTMILPYIGEVKFKPNAKIGFVKLFSTVTSGTMSPSRSKNDESESIDSITIESIGFMYYLVIYKQKLGDKKTLHPFIKRMNKLIIRAVDLSNQES